MKLTKERIAEARARCKAATPGNWYAIGSEVCGEVALPGGHSFRCVDSYPNADVDANFMAAAHSDLPAALDDLELLVEVAKAARQLLSKDYCGRVEPHCSDCCLTDNPDDDDPLCGHLADALAALGVEVTQ